MPSYDGGRGGSASADDEAGHHADHDDRQSHSGPGTTCVSCRKSKVKCDRGFPCSRCVRLGLACVATGPPVRGARRKARTPAAAQARLGQDARVFLLQSVAGENSGNADMPSIEEVIVDNLESRLTNSMTAAESKESVLILVRNWLAIALRRRSTDLLGKCFTLASQAGIDLDTLVVGDRGSTPSDDPPVMEFIKDLLFAPASRQEVLGEPMTVKSIPKPLTGTALFPEGQSPDSDIVFATRRTHRGLFSLYVSPPFEREIALKDDIEKAYKENSKQMLSFMFPPDEIEKVSRIVGVMFRTLSTQDSPPVVSVRTKALRKDGTVFPVSLYYGLYHIPTGKEEFATYALYRIVPGDAAPEEQDSVDKQRGASRSRSPSTPSTEGGSNVTALAQAARMVSPEQFPRTKGGGGGGRPAVNRAGAGKTPRANTSATVGGGMPSQQQQQAHAHAMPTQQQQMSAFARSGYQASPYAMPPQYAYGVPASAHSQMGNTAGGVPGMGGGMTALTMATMAGPRTVDPRLPPGAYGYPAMLPFGVGGVPMGAMNSMNPMGQMSMPPQYMQQQHAQQQQQQQHRPSMQSMMMQQMPYGGEDATASSAPQAGMMASHQQQAMQRGAVHYGMGGPAAMAAAQLMQARSTAAEGMQHGGMSGRGSPSQGSDANRPIKRSRVDDM